MQKPNFQLRHYLAYVLLLLIQRQKFPLHRIVQLAQIHPTDRPAYGDQHVHAGLDQYALIHSYVDLFSRFGLVDQDSRRKGCSTVAPVRQKSKRSVARLCDDARDPGLFHEYLERQQDFKMHE